MDEKRKTFLTEDKEVLFLKAKLAYLSAQITKDLARIKEINEILRMRDTKKLADEEQNVTKNLERMQL